MKALDTGVLLAILHGEVFAKDLLRRLRGVEVAVTELSMPRTLGTGEPGVGEGASDSPDRRGANPAQAHRAADRLAGGHRGGPPGISEAPRGRAPPPRRVGGVGSLRL